MALCVVSRCLCTQARLSFLVASKLKGKETTIHSNTNQRRGFKVDTLHGPIFTDREQLFQHIDSGILYDDENMMAINKPAGVPMTAPEGNPSAITMHQILDDFRLNYDLPELHFRLPLPRNHSGVVILSKNKMAAQRLEKSFRSARTEKEVHHAYLLVCLGTPQFTDTEVKKICFTRKPINGLLQTLIIERAGPSLKKTGEVKSVMVQPEILASTTDNLKVSLVRLNCNTAKHECLEAYMAENLAPILGDNLYSHRVTMLKGQPVRNDPNVAITGPQIIPPEIRHRLGIQEDYVTLCPLHLHKSTVRLKRFPTKKSDDIVITAPVPGYFEQTLRKLNLITSADNFIEGPGEAEDSDEIYDDMSTTT